MLWRARRAVRLPELRARKVPSVVREADVGQKPVRPLPGEDPAELGLRPPLIETGVSDRDARRVPAPLMRVEARGGPCGVAHPVRLEHLHGLTGQVLV